MLFVAGLVTFGLYVLSNNFPEAVDKVNDQQLLMHQAEITEQQKYTREKFGIEETTVSEVVVATEAVQTVAEIEVRDFKFIPETLTITKGTKVYWQNYDLVPHFVTQDTETEDGLLDFSSGMMRQGDKYFYTFTTPGTWPYHCDYHKEMQGQIIVLE